MREKDFPSGGYGVIVVTRNGAKTIGSTLNSIIDQTLQPTILCARANRIVLNSSITRCMNDEGIDYSFPMSFAGKVYSTSWVRFSDLSDKIVKPAVEEFWTKHCDVLPRKPETSVSSLEFNKRTLMIRTFFPKGNSRLLYDLQPKLQRMILERLDDYREKTD